MKHICIWLIKLYKKCISPITPPCCRFYPTCSTYALEAFQKRGFFVGFGLSVWRLLRCNPLGGMGYDPVPEKKVKPKSVIQNKIDREQIRQTKELDD